MLVVPEWQDIFVSAALKQAKIAELGVIDTTTIHKNCFQAVL
jgi:hypothetical protein